MIEVVHRDLQDDAKVSGGNGSLIVWSMVMAENSATRKHSGALSLPVSVQVK